MIPYQFQKPVVNVALNGSVGVSEGVGVDVVDGVGSTEVGVGVNVEEGRIVE